ncbi:MAG: hypothetical protein IH614_02445 [Desulfuromonadales bacterium]|nr:hypothetical protein [Desulfuromonadales bacterium]
MTTPPKGEIIPARYSEHHRTGSPRQQLTALSEQVAEKELELAELRTSLSHFQRRYYQKIGRRYVELDTLRARLAQRRAELAPEDEHSVRDAWYRHYRAKQSAHEFQEHQEQQPPVAAESERPPADDGAKRLYRAIAVQIHPDRAEGEAARRYRTALMAELNAAWEKGDLARMQAILEEWRSSPEAVAGRDQAAERQRLQRAIDRLEKRLAALTGEISRISSSELGRLMLKVREASARGRDLLADLAAELDLKIELTRQELEDLNVR